MAVGRAMAGNGPDGLLTRRSIHRGRVRLGGDRRLADARDSGPPSSSTQRLPALSGADPAVNLACGRNELERGNLLAASTKPRPNGGVWIRGGGSKADRADTIAPFLQR